MGVFDRLSGITGGDSEAAAEVSDDEETTPDPTDPAAMEPVDFRDRAEELAGRSNVPTLDFSVESLEKLDGLVAGASSPVDDPVAYGSYLGEVFVRDFDGDWVRDDGDWAVAVDLGDDDTTVAVFGAARMAMQKGPIFQDVAAKLEADGATRIDGDPPTHREIDAAAPPTTATDDAEADEPEDDPADAIDEPESDDGDDEDVAESETDDDADDADEPAESEVDEEADDAEEREADQDADDLDADEGEVAEPEAEAVEADDADAAEERHEEEATVEPDDEPEADDDGDDVAEIADDRDEESDAAGDEDETEDEPATDDGSEEDEDSDPAAGKPELDVTIDEIEMDDEVETLDSDEETSADDTADGDESTEDATADREPTQSEASGEPEDDAAVADQDVDDVAVDEDVDDATDDEATTESDAIEPDDEPDASETESVQVDDTDDDASEEADATDDGDDEGLGVASRIAELAESGGDPDSTAAEDDEPTDEEPAAEDADEEDDGDLDAEGHTTDEADDAETDEGEADESEATEDESTDDEAVSPVETIESDLASDAADSPPDLDPVEADDTDDEAGDVVEDEADASQADTAEAETDAAADGDEVLEDLAAEVSGPELPPRPELKRAARDFAEDWSDRGFDFTPESLARLDGFLDGQWAGRFRPGTLDDASPHPREGLTPFARVGAYFGQMLVEHLDGEWVPTENGEGAVALSGRRGRAEEVAVFDVARTCLTRESTFAYRFDALANRFDVDAEAREADDVFDVGGERADSTAVIPAILDRAEDFTEEWSGADLDYSPASLSRLDDLVDGEFAVTDLSNARLGDTTDADSLRFTERVTSAGAYYAAVLVSHLDANWQLEGDVRLIVEGPDGSRTVDPVTVAVGCIRGDDTFASHFDRLADRVGREPATAD